MGETLVRQSVFKFDLFESIYQRRVRERILLGLRTALKLLA